MLTTQEVSVLDTLDAGELRGLQADFHNFPGEFWRAHYTEYHTGGWKTAPLLNPSGRATDAIVCDGAAMPTAILDRVPNVTRFLETRGFRYMFARAAMLEPGAMLWEHIDYRELRPTGRLRLHVPVATNAESFIVIRGTRVHMRAGLLWKLDPRSPHGVANFGPSPRIHLILDCYVDDRIGNMVQREQFPVELMSALPMATREQAAEQDEECARMLQGSDLAAAERYLLSKYFSYSFAPGALYKRLIVLCKKHCQHAHGDLWESRAQAFLGIGVHG